ncbi:MAG: S8 family serine peptidase [Actinomycetota bacterium]
MPGDGVVALSRDGRVASVTPDYEITMQGDSFVGRPSTTYAATVRADELWRDGVTGSGIGVALLDTGVSDHPDLAGRVVASADLTTEGTFTDSYGHGTFLAGLITGTDNSPKPGTSGVAPGAHLVSVKVAGADGDTTLGQVLYGLQLIDASSERYNVRVVVMALAGPATDGPDPLILAVERLWADGLVVVAAAGNSGPTAGSVASPGVDPYVVTVGGTDEGGTTSMADDTVPEWSARGPSVFGLPKPDLVAPGKSLVSLRVPGSTIDEANPGARVGDSYFRGTGTSMSAAVAAGGVALLLERDPSLTPDEVKGRLLAGARPIAEADPNAAGRGGLDVVAASEARGPVANAELPAFPVRGKTDSPADPFGPGRRSFDWFASPVGPDRWLARGWAHRAWSGTEFVARGWAARGWAGSDWSARGWADSEWAGRGWAARGWAARGWAARGWSSSEWSARGWAGVEWAAERWK